MFLMRSTFEIQDNDSGVASVMRDDSMVASNNMPQPIDKAHIIEKYGD
jgi:hypothetical protein